jgi:hypothetical protein
LSAGAIETLHARVRSLEQQPDMSKFFDGIC